MRFDFQLDSVDANELVRFCFELLVSAALLRYKAQIDIEKCVGVTLERDERRESIERTFGEALDKLSVGSILREPLRRYISEVAIPFAEEDEEPSPRPGLKLVP